MKILYINALYSPHIAGGAELSLKLLAEGMQAYGHEVAVLSLVPEGRLRTEIVDGVKVYRTGIQNHYWPFTAHQQPKIRRLAWHLRDRYNTGVATTVQQVLALEKPDLVSCHNLVGWSVAVWDVIKRAGIPVVQVLHDLYLLCPNSNMFRDGIPCSKQCRSCRLLRTGHRERSANVQAVVGISRSILQRFTSAGYFRGAKTAVIYNARSIPAPSGKRHRTHGSTLRFGFIGTLSAVKGVEWLIRSFRQLGIPAMLDIAGRGKETYEEELKALAGDDARIRFRGYIQPTGFYREMDVLVVPSLWEEPLGMVAIEGLANHLPVIASDMGGLRETVRHEQNGLLCDPADEHSLRDAMLRLYEDSELYSRMAAAARPSAERFLQPARMVDEYQQLLKTIESA